MESFRSGVGEQLGHYVYMLIDPRNGHTFYVGRGQGDRVFAHVSGSVREDEEDNGDDDSMPLKLRVIRGIRMLSSESVGGRFEATCRVGRVSCRSDTAPSGVMSCLTRR